MGSAYWKGYYSHKSKWAFLIGRWLFSRFSGPYSFHLVALPSREPWTPPPDALVLANREECA